MMRMTFLSNGNRSSDGARSMFFLIMVFGVCLVSGCQENNRSRARRDNTLYLTDPDPIRTLDPAIGYDTTSLTYERAILEGLLDYDEEANLIPALATSWTITPDGRTFRSRTGFSGSPG